MSVIVEEYDAQMMDYAMDSDVHMHTSLPSPKNDWPHQEATMEDATLTEHPVDVEVDMDQYYEDAVEEYEMADENDIGTAHAEPVDVEVYDAARETDPQIFEPQDASIPTDSTAQFSQPHIAVFTDNDNSATLGTLGSQEPSVPTPVENPFVAPTVTDASASSIVSEGHHAVVTTSPVDASTHSVPQPESVVQPHLDFAPTSATETSEQLHPAPEAYSDHVEHIPTVTHEGEVTLEKGEYPAHPETVGDATIPPHPAPSESAPDDHEPESHHQSESQHDEAPSQAPEDPVIAPPEVVDNQAQQSAQPEDYGHEDHHPTDAPQPEDQADPEAGDPHEISEGVYIDPPPPVLLDLPSSSDQPECCLFNVPTSRSGSHSPVEPHSAGAYTVLLASRPTLYYERLSDVFQALREEERVSGVPELYEGELVLDAYDLQLAISEDNAHANEVNLHDLNELHDSLGLTGPLRLQLRSFVPRFITRYRSLKEQIARLNLGEEDREAQEPSAEQHDQMEHEHELDDGHHHEDDGEVPQTEEEYYDSLPHEEYAEQVQGQPEPEHDENQEEAPEEELADRRQDQDSYPTTTQEQTLLEQSFAPVVARALDPDTENQTASELINDQEHHPGYPDHEQQGQEENPDYHEVGVRGEESRALEDENEYGGADVALREVGQGAVEEADGVVHGEVEEVDNSFGADDEEAAADGTIVDQEYDESLHRTADTDEAAGVGQDNTEYEELVEPREEEEKVGEEYPGEAFGGEVRDGVVPGEGEYYGVDEQREALEGEVFYDGEYEEEGEGEEVAIDDVQHDETNDVEGEDIEGTDADGFDDAGTDITDAEASRLLDQAQALSQSLSHSVQGSQAGPGSVSGSNETDYVENSTEDIHEVEEETQQVDEGIGLEYPDETFDTTLAEAGDDVGTYDDASFGEDGDPNVDELAEDADSQQQHAPAGVEGDPDFDDEDEDDLYDVTAQEFDPEAHENSTESTLSSGSAGGAKMSSKRSFEEVDSGNFDDLEAEREGGDLSPGSKRARVH